MARTARWTYRYNYQLAGYLVCQGGERLRDIFPSREAACAAVAHLNRGGSAETIPDPEPPREDEGAKT